MTLIDERGRIGGRFNLIDAAAAIVLILMVPVAFAAFLLFRSPAPRLVRVVPATLAEGPDQRLEIDGENFRPFMRVSFDTAPAKSFLLGSTKYALVDVPDLKPGTYDVVLYDYMREVARLPKALTVAPMATDVELEVSGAFKAPPESFATQLKVGDTFPSTAQPIAEVVELGGAVPGDLRLHVGDQMIAVPVGRRDVAATLRVKCATVRGADGVARCAVPDAGHQVIVAPDTLLTIETPHGPVLFQIVTARAPARPIGQRR